MKDDEIRDMPIISGRGFRRFRLDGRQCFKLWTDRGTAKKAMLALKELGVRNSRGNPYTEAAVGMSAKKWALWHEKEARKIYEEKYGEITDKIWYDFLLTHNHLLGKFSAKTYEQWKILNPEVMEYKNSLEQETV